MTKAKTYKKTKTNTKCFQDPIYAIFFISRGFKDLKYYIYWLSSCDDKDIDKDPILCIIRGEYSFRA